MKDPNFHKVDFEGMFMVPVSVVVPMESGALIKSIDTIEEEVNFIIAHMWKGITEQFPGGEVNNEAQHELCHLASQTYEMYKSHALEQVMQYNNDSLWVLIEQLTDKMIACDEHVPELGL